MKVRLFLHAPNVHNGGGLTLLKALLKVIPDGTCLIIDERLLIDDRGLSRCKIFRIKPTVWCRFMAERLLVRETKENDTVLCFGNLPPLFSLKAKVTLFIQNRYLVEPKLMSSVPVKLRIRLGVERLWLRYFQKNAERIIVQTASMKTLVCKCVSAPVTVAPFLAFPTVETARNKKSEGGRKYDFIYVASGEPHKNHKNLIDAWVELGEEGLFPSLCLTVNPEVFPKVVRLIKSKNKQYELNIENINSVTGEGALEFYKSAEILIFPSTLESFGLPLIEARAAGLRIVASELDYVRDILDPEESFDPHSPTSIVRAVKRMMKLESKVNSLISAQDFIDLLDVKESILGGE